MGGKGGEGGQYDVRKRIRERSRGFPFNGQEIIIVVHKGEQHQLNETNCFCEHTTKYIRRFGNVPNCT